MFLLCRLLATAATVSAAVLVFGALLTVALLAAVIIIPVTLAVGIRQGYRQHNQRSPRCPA